MAFQKSVTQTLPTEISSEGPDGRQCSDIPHNLTLFDEDTPDSACKHKYCPSCILEMRKYCLPQDDEKYCEPLLAQVMHNVSRAGRYGNERFDEGTEKVCKAIGAHCDGLCGDMIDQVLPVSGLIDKRQATPYKICKTFKLC
ncbi:hypothetical protein Ddc_18418 [Ditylenchus destructor]|nr:hypothetical protein Ddc_18418 [Ditylenchus destructor]